MKVKHNSINFSVPHVDDLQFGMDKVEDGDVIIVTDKNRGGTFIYDSTLTVDDNDSGTIFNGWRRDYSGAVNVKWFGANETRVDNEVPIQLAINSSSNVFIPFGTFTISNTLNIVNCSVEGDKSIIYMELTADNWLASVGSKSQLSNLVFKTLNTDTPNDYGGGHVIRMNEYFTDGNDIYDVAIRDCDFINMNTDYSKSTICVSVMGNTHQFELSNLTFNGRYDSAIVCHWGGDIDINDPHHSMVTKSWHPGDGTIESISIGKDTKNGIILMP